MRICLLLLIVTVTMTSQAWAQSFYIGGQLGGGTSLLSPSSIVTDGYLFLDARGFAGANLTDGPSMFGIEVSLGGDLKQNVFFTSRDTATNSFPVLLSTQFGHPGPSFPTSGVIPGPEWTGGFSTRDYRTTRSLQRLASGIVSARIGHQMDDLLIYGRVGGGITLVEITSISDDSRTVWCRAYSTEWHMRPDGFDTYATDCLDPRAGVVTSSTTHHPSALLSVGIGVEKSWGQIFGRLEAEMTHVFLDGGGIRGFTDYGVSAGFGFRF